MRYLMIAAILTLGTAFGLSACTKASGQKGQDSESSPLVKETIEYKHAETTLEGYLAHPEREDGADPLPAIVVVHNWMGLTELTKERCDMLAAKGYVAFAADIYGKGVRPANTQEAAQQAGKYRGDRELLRARAQAAVDYVKGLDAVDADKVCAIGFCFGGGTVLELARSGSDIQGVVSFHGNLDTPNAEDAENITCKVAVHHGADDPYVEMSAVTALEEELSAAGVDFQITVHGDAVHSFTNPNAGDDKSKGSAYHERTAKRAWAHAFSFFDECFSE